MDSHKLIDKPVVMTSDPLTVSEIREYRNSALEESGQVHAVVNVENEKSLPIGELDSLDQIGHYSAKPGSRPLMNIFYRRRSSEAMK